MFEKLSTQIMMCIVNGAMKALGYIRVTIYSFQFWTRLIKGGPKIYSGRYYTQLLLKCFSGRKEAPLIAMMPSDLYGVRPVQ